MKSCELHNFTSFLISSLIGFCCHFWTTYEGHSATHWNDLNSERGLRHNFSIGLDYAQGHEKALGFHYNNERKLIYCLLCQAAPAPSQNRLGNHTYATKFAVSPMPQESYLKANLLMWATHAVFSFVARKVNLKTFLIPCPTSPSPCWKQNIVPGCCIPGYHRLYKSKIQYSAPRIWYISDRLIAIEI